MINEDADESCITRCEDYLCSDCDLIVDIENMEIDADLQRSWALSASRLRLRYQHLFSVIRWDRRLTASYGYAFLQPGSGYEAG